MKKTIGLALLVSFALWSIVSGDSGAVSPLKIEGVDVVELLLQNSLEPGPTPPGPSVPLMCQQVPGGGQESGAIPGNPYCGKSLGDFDPPDWDCPEPPDGCYYSVDALCYEDALDDFQEAMKALYDQACADYETARDAKHLRDLTIFQEFQACLESTTPQTEERLQCYVTRNEASAASFQQWQDDQAAIASTVATGTAGAEGAFLAAVVQCCFLVCPIGGGS